MGGVFDIIAETTKPEENDQGTIPSALADNFKASSEHLKMAMRLLQAPFTALRTQTSSRPFLPPTSTDPGSSHPS